MKSTQAAILNRDKVAAAQPSAGDWTWPTWSIPLFGLCLFTISVVTVRVPLADVGMLIGAAGLLLQRDKFRFPAPAAVLAVFILWAYATIAFSNYPTMALHFSNERLKLLVIFVVAVNALRTEAQIRFYIWFYLACFVLSPGRGSIQGYIGGNTIWGRLMWNYNYNNPNDMAALTLLATGFALAVATSLREKPIARKTAWGFVLMFTIIIALTQSRGAVLGAALGFGPALFRTFLKKGSTVFYAVATVAVLIVFVPDSAWQRFGDMKNLTNSATLAEADPEGSAENRLEIKKAAIQLFLERPITGSGVGTYSKTMGHEFPVLGPKDTHDTYLNLAAELGLPGLLLWCTMTYMVLARARRSRLAAAAANPPVTQIWIERAAVSFLVCGFFGTYSGITYIYLYFGVLWALGTLHEPPDSIANRGWHA